MSKFDWLKSLEVKTNNFYKRIKSGSEALENRIIEGRAKYFLEPIPGIGHYFWRRSLGKSRDVSIEGAVIEGVVRSIPIAAFIVTGNPSFAVASEGFYDTIYESTTFLQSRKMRIEKQKALDANWNNHRKQMDVAYG